MSDNEHNSYYNVPFEIQLTFSTKAAIGLFAAGVGMVLFPFWVFGDADSPTHIRAIAGCCFPLGLLLMWLIIYQNILKKRRVEVTSHGISDNNMWRKKRVIPFENIEGMEIHEVNSNKFLGFITTDKLKEVQKGSLSSTFNASMGGLYGYSIPLAQIQQLDTNRVIATFQHLIDHKPQVDKANQKTDAPEPAHEKVISNIPKAIATSLVFATMAGFTYALSVYLLNINILVLPILLMWGVIHNFGKSVAVADYKLPLRLWITLLGGYVVFFARVFLAFLENSQTHSLIDFFGYITSYFEYLPGHLKDEFFWLLAAVLTAGMSFFNLSGLGIFKRKPSK